MDGIINIAITESVLISGWIGFPEELNRFMQIIMNGKQSLCMAGTYRRFYQCKSGNYSRKVQTRNRKRKKLQNQKQSPAYPRIRSSVRNAGSRLHLKAAAMCARTVAGASVIDG